MTIPDSSSPLSLAEGLSREFLLHHRCCPMTIDADGALVVAADDGVVLDAIDDIGIAYRRAVVRREVSPDELERLIERIVTRADRAIELERAEDAGGMESSNISDVRDLARQAPVIRYVNLLVRDAYEAGASDIHLEATRTGLAARFRLDGVLVPALEPPAELERAIVSRVKLLAELDIAERRRPQDGRIRVHLDERELDLRVSTVPTMFGESVVLRLLERGGRPVGLEDLGLSSALLRSIERLSQLPHGLLLVTGPTGSGKTTTLYACLQQRDHTREKIITVEDPVEYQHPFIAQVPVHRQAGVTFGEALRSILRQDPDVLMIGEMRDAETAEIAIQAAMTGHLVFSTLHTNDAIGAVPRLFDLGVPEYLVSATLEGILAQRLVRRICDACRASYTPSPELVSGVAGRPVGSMRLQRGLGCSACRGTGYRGRVGLFELVIVSDAIKDAIARRVNRGELRRIAEDEGTLSLRMHGWQQVQAGLTTVEEVLRVAQA